MLYIFKSGATGELTMLEESAEQVLVAIGKTPAPKGVIAVEDMTAAIEQLQVAMQFSQQQTCPEKDDDGAEKYDQNIPFHTRAWPFLKMLQRSLESDKAVTWGL